MVNKSHNVWEDVWNSHSRFQKFIYEVFVDFENNRVNKRKIFPKFILLNKHLKETLVLLFLYDKSKNY